MKDKEILEEVTTLFLHFVFMTERQVIEDRYQDMYTWDMNQNRDNEVQFTIPLPQSVDASKIICELTENGENVCVRIPDALPFICGHTKFPIESISGQQLENSYIVTAILKEPSKVEAFIDGPHQETTIIDPFSHFILFNILLEQAKDSGDMAKIGEAFEYIRSLAQVNFIPAVVCLADYICTTKNHEEAEKLFKESFKASKSPIIAYRIALLEFKKGTEEGYKESFRYFEVAQEDPNLISAKSFLGLFYSPCSEIPFAQKDAKKAAELFEAVLASYPDEIITLQAYAVLLYVGTGIKRDKQRAISLNKHARELEPRIQELDRYVKEHGLKPEEGLSTATLAAVGIGSALLVAGIGFIVMKRSKK